MDFGLGKREILLMLTWGGEGMRASRTERGGRGESFIMETIRSTNPGDQNTLGKKKTKEGLKCA